MLVKQILNSNIASEVGHKQTRLNSIEKILFPSYKAFSFEEKNVCLKGFPQKYFNFNEFIFLNKIFLVEIFYESFWG